jgi:sialate O-acetylesterase
VTVTLAGASAEAQADADGCFRAELPGLPAGGPFELAVTPGGDDGAGRAARVQDVLVGEVWLCAGGSNMRWPLSLATPAPGDASAASDPALRLCLLPEQHASYPRDGGAAVEWLRASPAAAADFSAAAFCFGRALRAELPDVPLGLVVAALPFAHIEPWIPAAAMQGSPVLEPVLQQAEREQAEYRAALRPALPGFRAWLASARGELDAGRLPPPMPALPLDPLLEATSPTALFNGMIEPFAPLPVAGVAWYQGEQNIADGARYTGKLLALIRGWRAAFERDDLPFAIVQLTPYRYGQRRPTEKAPEDPNPLRLPEFWEAQASAALLPHTGLIVTTDLAELDNVFPLDKHALGRRLADWALATVYGRARPASSPLFASLKLEVGRARVRFKSTGGGLATRDGQPPSWFEVAGADKRFARASASIEGNDVIVWSDAVPQPVAVRFAWHQECQPNLVGKSGLPAMPFRAHAGSR